MAFLAFGVLVITFVVLLPVGVKMYVTSWLKNNGADTADINDIDINLFTGTLRLKGVDIKKGDKVVFGNSDIMVDIGLKNLFKKNVLLERASLSDVVLDIEQSPKGDLRIASYSSKASTTDTKTEELPSEPSAWTFTAKMINLDNVAVRYAMPDLTVNAQIDHMVLERFTTASGPFNGMLELVGQLNGSPVKLTLDKLDVRHGVAVSGDISITDFRLDNLAAILKKSADIEAFTGKAGLDGKINFQLDEEGKILTDYDGIIQVEGLDLALQGTSVSGSVKWQGKSNVQVNKGETDADINGELTLGNTQATLADKTIISLQSATITAQADLAAGTEMRYGGRVDAAVKQFALNKGAESWAAFESLALSGEKKTDEDTFLVENITLDSLNLPASGMQPYAIDVKQLSIPAVSGTLDLAALQITSPEIATVRIVQPPQLQVDIDSISSPAIQVESANSAASSNISLSGINVVSNTSQKADVGLKKLTVSSFSYGPADGTVIDAIVLDLLNADIVVPKAAEVKAAKNEQPADTEVAASGKAENASGAVPLQIGSVTISKDSVVSYRDETSSKIFSVKAQVDELQVKDIDLKTRQKPITYVVKLKVDDYGRLTVDGQAELAPVLKLSQKLSLRNYPAVGISPFIESAAGNSVNSGRIQLFSDFLIDGAKFESENQVVLNEFQTQLANNDQADQFNAKLPLPLDTALYLLRDDKDNIALSVPIGGEFGRMSVGIQDIVITAVSKSLTLALTPYLAYTFLGPTGALVYLGAEVGKSLLDTDYPVIQFETGRSEIPEDQLERLDKIGKSLQKSFSKKSDESISICAKVRQDEAVGKNNDKLSDNEMRKKLFALGDARANAVRKYLVDTYSLDGEKLNSCSPGLLFEKGKKPYVQFMQ